MRFRRNSVLHLDLPSPLLCGDFTRRSRLDQGYTGLYRRAVVQVNNSWVSAYPTFPRADCIPNGQLRKIDLPDEE